MSVPAKIYYGLVAYGKMVLCDSSPDKNLRGSFEFLCQTALESVQTRSRKGTQQEYHFNRDIDYSVFVYRSLELCYLCVVSKSFKRSLALACLRAVEEKFRECGLEGRAGYAGHYSMRSNFSSSLTAILTEFSSQDALAREKEEVGKHKDALRRQINWEAQQGELLRSVDTNIPLRRDVRKKISCKDRLRRCFCCCPSSGTKHAQALLL